MVIGGGTDDAESRLTDAASGSSSESSSLPDTRTKLGCKSAIPRPTVSSLSGSWLGSMSSRVTSPPESLRQLRTSSAWRTLVPPLAVPRKSSGFDSRARCPPVMRPSSRSLTRLYIASSVPSCASDPSCSSSSSSSSSSSAVSSWSSDDLTAR
ncbi:hypothetical protein PLICRDRAFT_422060 [Plicaturopsis crispa FD-325 SS-3]|nr:hypothetical protein PLICRDRAFT_422060 [Plicaturopsis crispa FD-325 SS-3]